MKMVESIKELRKIVRKTESTYSNKIAVQPFFYIKFLRFFSVYFVKLGILLKMTPNQMTFVSMVTAIIGGIFLSFANPIYTIIGGIFLILFSILDCADGELARYLKKRTPMGRYFDLWVHGIESSSIFIGLTYGVYNTTSNTIAFIFGFICVAGFLLRAYSGALKNFHMTEYALQIGNKNIFKPKKSPFAARLKLGPFSISNYALKQILSFFTVPYLIILVAIADMFTIPMSIDIMNTQIMLNWRFALLIFFAIVVPFIVYKTVKETIGLNDKIDVSKVNG